MKAAVLNKFGSVEAFVVKSIPDPFLKKGQILVKNVASSVNPVDIIVRKGKKVAGSFVEDLVIGGDFSGVVVASRSIRFKEGEEVFGFQSAITGNAYAELVAVDEDNAAIKPSGISFLEAASLPLVASTALQALMYDGKLQRGDHVLINGCTSGVGAAAVQIAKYYGATVTGTCRGENMELAKTLGCDTVVNYQTEKLPLEDKYDLVFDAAGKFVFSDVKIRMKEDAMFVSTRGGTDSLFRTAETAFDLLFKKQVKIVIVKPASVDLFKLKTIIDEGKLKAHIAKVFPLDELNKAHIMMETGGFAGKVVVEITPEMVTSQDSPL